MPTGWRITGGKLVLSLDRKTGGLATLTIVREKEFVWSSHPGDVTVRDDRLNRTFGRRDLIRVEGRVRGRRLILRKIFRGAPWTLHETYAAEPEAIHWTAEVVLDRGDCRSCAVSYRVPWPMPLYPVSFWSARDGMPSAPHRFAEIALEYGEITSGILMPALSCYLKEPSVGLLLTMPFDFRTPRFRFVSAYREPDLQATFDWLALAPGRPARTSLLLCATPGDWRPALGWLYERFKEYFEPRSTLIRQLWGGHVSGGFNVSLEAARQMAALGLKWHEVHAHFPAYGNYHPEGVKAWRSGHYREDPTMITAVLVRQTIRNLHRAGAAALLYLQVSGDGDAQRLDRAFDRDRIRDIYGEPHSAWPGTYLMNSDPALSFGKDMARQIKGIVARYPEMDGIFLDQPCYNFLDTAHDDGLTAVNNRPGYMTGFNYFPHLERLSTLLHPRKAIIGNAPFGVGILKYIDGCMAEGSTWLCDHLQYYGLAKPLFFLEYDTARGRIENMFQQCLIHACGFTSYPAARPSKDLFDKYLPLLTRLYPRRWVFDVDPLRLPNAFRGGIYRSPDGSLLASVVGGAPRLSGRKSRDHTIHVQTRDIEQVRRVTLQPVGGSAKAIPFHRENNAIQFDVPRHTVAAVAELRF